MMTMTTCTCPYCETTVKQKRSDGRCVSCGKLLPDELRGTPDPIVPPVEKPVAKRSIFRDFIAALRRHWRSVLPSVLPVRVALGYSASGNGMSVPKASTFFAGYSPDLATYVFIMFDHSTKPWEVGRFRTMVILSHRENAPVVWHKPWYPDDGVLTEGAYDVGLLIGRKIQSWWCLRKDGISFTEIEWKPASYDDPTQVIVEAVADVTRNVLAVLEQLKVQIADAELDTSPEVPPPPKPKKPKPKKGSSRKRSA